MRPHDSVHTLFFPHTVGVKPQNFEETCSSTLCAPLLDDDDDGGGETSAAARARLPSGAAMTAFCGTPHYMAPEAWGMGSSGNEAERTNVDARTVRLRGLLPLVLQRQL